MQACMTLRVARQGRLDQIVSSTWKPQLVKVK
jgi:hypothetical protein